MRESVFDIKTGLELRNAFITDKSVTVDESIFTKGQITIVEKLLREEREKLQTEFAKVLEEEKRTAWQNGNQAGVTQTTNQMLSQVTPVIEEMEKVINNLNLQTDTFLKFHEQEILNLIIKIARKVIDVEVSLNPEIILNTLARCLEFLTEKDEIRIIVNPTEIEIIKENLNKLSLSYELPKNVDILGNAEILPGGCRVDFKAGSIDADIETQFAEIKRNLLKE